MSLPNFPCIRKTNSVPGKPMFVSDAIIADMGIMSAMSTLLNDSTGFHILSGMTVVGSAVSAGIVSLGGVIYYCPGCTIGQYLIPNLVDVDSRLHSDGNSYVTYREYQVQAAGSPSSGSSPQLTALTIDNYRVDLNLLLSKSLKTGSSNTLTVTLTSATPVVGADSQAASVVANISSNYSGTVEYDYHIGINTNIIYFNVNLTGYYGVYPTIFKIYNSSNVLIKTLTTAGVLTNWKFLAINDGTTWHFITGTDDLLGDAAFKDTGTAAGTVCAGNDSRLSDARETKDVAGVTLHTKQVNIGNWNMNSTSTVYIAHGIADFTKIKRVSAIIIKDDSSEFVTFDGINGQSRALSVNIQLDRTGGTLFDSVDYDTASFNRGYILIEYIS